MCVCVCVRARPYIFFFIPKRARNFTPIRVKDDLRVLLPTCIHSCV